jgi:diaminopropionate ammonia-lyase
VHAIEQLGATVVTTPPSYDAAVLQVAADAARNGPASGASNSYWHIVSDTGYDGYEDIPRDVMDGYTIIAQEALEQIGEPPTHVFLQAGVGSFAAAVAQHLWLRLGNTRPTIIVVEPAGAACVQQSIIAGRPVVLPDVHSIMGGLCCGVVSSTAWDVLHSAADWTLSIPDSAIPPAMRALYDVNIVAGESGAAGAAALDHIASNPNLKEQIGLNEDSRVLFFITEGATDPVRWAELTGLEVSA